MKNYLVYESDYCSVYYQGIHNFVLLTWKKYCCHDDYRNPSQFALELLKKFKDSNFAIDARNGFKDNQDDVLWVFTYLISEISKITCNHIVSIMNQINSNESEMDMWTKEFRKYFFVHKVNIFTQAINVLGEKKMKKRK